VLSVQESVVVRCQIAVVGVRRETSFGMDVQAKSKMRVVAMFCVVPEEVQVQ
jgi:hypothetical protein